MLLCAALFLNKLLHLVLLKMSTESLKVTIVTWDTKCFIGLTQKLSSGNLNVLVQIPNQWFVQWEAIVHYDSEMFCKNVLTLFGDTMAFNLGKAGVS